MENLKEITLSQELKYEGKIINLRVDTVELPNGKQAKREVVEHSGGVCVVAIDENDCLLMVNQFRYPYKEITLEIPAGKINYGEDPKECGKRELEEETGYTAKEFVKLSHLYPTVAYCNEIIHVYLAKDLVKTAQHLDEDEFLTVERIPFEQAVEMVMDNKIPDAKTQIAILKVYALKTMGKL